MSLNHFIPTIWSAKLFSELDKAHVFVGRCNTDYEGEISQFGDSVKINAIGDITVSDYTKNSTTVTAQELADAQTILNIDQSKYFAFFIDDVDKVQQKPKVMGEAMRKAAYALRDVSDQHVAGKHGEAGTKLTLGNTKAAKAIEHLAVIGQSLDDKDVPQEGRWLVAPPWFIAKLSLAKVISTDGSVDANDVWANGMVGRAMGFDIFMSNNVVKHGSWAAATPRHYMLAGTNRAMTFAQQILQMEAYRPESKFADAVKGLYVYGHKVIDPDCLVRADATFEAE